MVQFIFIFTYTDTFSTLLNVLLVERAIIFNSFSVQQVCLLLPHHAIKCLFLRFYLTLGVCLLFLLFPYIYIYKYYFTALVFILLKKVLKRLYFKLSRSICRPFSQWFGKQHSELHNHIQEDSTYHAVYTPPPVI